MPALTTGAAAGFYEATAQILPIFLLAMLIGEARMGVAGKKRPKNLAISLSVYVGLATIMVAGEVAALISIGSDETRFLHNLVCAAVGAGVAFLMMRFLLSTLDQYRDHLSAKAQDRHALIALIVVLLILFGTQVTLALNT